VPALIVKGVGVKEKFWIVTVAVKFAGWFGVVVAGTGVFTLGVVLVAFETDVL
jgi:hypothetical protein